MASLHGMPTPVLHGAGLAKSEGAGGGRARCAGLRQTLGEDASIVSWYHLCGYGDTACQH